jgi:hypothetical protein
MSPTNGTGDDETRSHQPASGPLAQAGAALASLAEAWLRDTVMYAVVLLSLGAVLAGFSADGAGRAVAGTAVGLSAAVAAVVPTVRRWPALRIWAALLAVAVTDVVVILLLVSG